MKEENFLACLTPPALHYFNSFKNSIMIGFHLKTPITRDLGRPSRWERRLSRLMLWGEDLIKVPLFNCQHCGECILSHTAFICSQRCPKRLRNGPCGGTREDGHCEVYPERRCIWHRIAKRSALLRRRSLLERVEFVHNWRLESTSAWLNVFTRRIHPPILWIRKARPRDTE